MPQISDVLRQFIAERAHGLCEYCQTAEIIVVSLEIDHIVPQAAGGITNVDNLCLVCRGCNAFKQDFQEAVDPDTQKVVALFNPRTQLWTEHFRWSEDGVLVIGLTPTGRATIERLRMNRPAVVAARRLWVSAGWHPPHTARFPSH